MTDADARPVDGRADAGSIPPPTPPVPEPGTLPRADADGVTLQSVIDAMPAAVYAYDHAWRCVRVNGLARRALHDAGVDADAFLGRVLWEAVPDLVGGPFHAHMLRAAREGVAVRFEAANRHGGGWTETTVFPTAFGVVAYTHGVEDRRRAGRRERLLVEAGALLSGGRDERATLAAVADMAVHDFADACLVTLRAAGDESTDAPRRILAVEAASRDPEVARELRALAHAEHGGPSFDAAVARTGRAELHALLAAEPASVALPLAPLHAALPASPPASAIVAPLVVRDRVVGTIAFLRLATPGFEPFDADDLACAEELGRRAAVAIDGERLFAAEREARARAERLQALTAALAGARSLDDVARVVVADMVVALGARTGALAGRASDGALVLLRTVGFPERVAAGVRRQPVDLRSPLVECFRTRAPVWIETRDGPAGLDARFPPIAPVWDALGVGSAAFVPLIAAGDAVGVISFAFERSRAFPAEERAFLLALGQQAALAVERARLFDAEHAARAEAERTAARAARVAAAASAFNVASTVAEVTAVLLRESHAALGADAALVAVVHEDAREIEIVDSIGFPDYLRGEWRRFPVDAPVPLGEAVRLARPVYFESEAERAGRYPATPATGYEAGLVVPLISGGRLIGVLALSFAAPGALGEDDRRLLDTLAQQWAQALDRAQLYEAERRARDEAEAARRAAESANRSKAEFLAVMSHELRTPLNAIAGYVQLLELEVRGPVTAAQRLDLERIQTAQRTLLRRINDVLNFAKLEAGHVEFELRDVRVADLVAAVEPLVAPQVAARRLAYACALPDPDLRVRVDAEKAGQVLLNLVSNAVKFTPAGGRVELSAAALDDAHVAIRVRDTGVGIPPEKLASVFEPFVQVDARLNRVHEGTGLGLAISRDLVRGMGGELSVTSTVGVGSTFVVALPRVH